MEHIFWLEHHPRSINGIIEYLALNDRVYCICYDDGMFEGRSSMGWTNESIGGAEFFYLNRETNVDLFLKKFIASHQEAVNYIMGVRASNISRFVNKYVFTRNEARVFMIAERPYLYGKNIASKIILKLLYKYLGFKYKDKITGVFAMGTMGVEAYKTWAHGNVFPFLYPKFNNVVTTGVSMTNTPDTIRALYVGQFDRRKGIDVLLDVFESLPDNIHLDVVGANGDIKDVVLNRINSMQNVSYVGVWKSNEVATKSAGYDVCVVPSRYDGWGMYVMEALEAGVGVITTDMTGGKDLVCASGAGLVVKSGSVGSLASAFSTICERPAITTEWKKKAVDYKQRISQYTVGKYFQQIVSHKNNHDMQIINCPWL